jgi:hypothetical protein
MIGKGRATFYLSHPSAFLKTDVRSDVMYSSILSILSAERRPLSFQTIPHAKGGKTGSREL